MKRLWLAVIGWGWVACAGAQAEPRFLTAAEGVSCAGGVIRLGWVSRTLLDESFPEGVATWQVENYEKALSFDRRQADGASFLSIRREGQKCDTAFSLSSPAVAVTPGTAFDLSITARGAGVFARARGHRDKYGMCIRWLAADGRTAGMLPFGLNCKEDAWQETRVSGSVPAEAARAVVSIGADSPDILPDRPLDIRRVVLAVQSPGAYRPAGEALSRPLPFTEPAAKVEWDAACPPGTRVTLQVSSAPDDHGAPGAWSPFRGPDGAPAGWFETSGQRLPPFAENARWLRYRVRLGSDRPSQSPVLNRVKIGAAEDGGWGGLDQTPPALEVLTPQLASDASAPVVFRLSDGVGINPASLRFWADGQEETGRLVRKGGAFVFSPASPFVPAGKPRDPQDVVPNLHLFRVAVEDQAGNRMEKSWPLLVGGRSGGSRVTLRKDGAVLVDQKPFFPIGIYAVWKKAFNSNSFDRAFGELKAKGFNVAHTYNSARTAEFREFMDAAVRHGLRLFLASGESANAMDIGAVLEDVARERSHPAVLAWYLADDTAMHVMPRQLAALTDAIRAIDPDHITVQADGVGDPPQSNYAAFVGATDGFLPELYPIRGDDDVPRIITDMQTLRADIEAAGSPVKTVWPIIQYFEGWGWPRFPTAAELRAMSFLALIHGANGITWYTYGGHGNNHGATYTEETWRTMCSVSKEIAGLQEVLLAETVAPPQVTVVAGPQKDSLGHPSLSVMEKRWQGRRYLLCANSAKAEIQATFAWPEAKSVADRQEPARPLSFARGVLSDTFPPYGVRVYVAE